MPTETNTREPRWAIGDKVRKKRGSSWRGTVVGFYSTEHTPTGYCIDSAFEPGSVQVWPEAALEPWDEGCTCRSPREWDADCPDHILPAAMPDCAYDCPEPAQAGDVEASEEHRNDLYDKVVEQSIEIGALKAAIAAYEAAKGREVPLVVWSGRKVTAQIVAWLRSSDRMKPFGHNAMVALKHAADSIEAGQHLKEPSNG